MNIAKVLNKLLKEKNITVYKMAKDLNMSENSLRYICNGKTDNPHVLTLQALSKYLGVDINVFLQDSNVEDIKSVEPQDKLDNLDSVEKRLINHFRKLDDTQKEKIIDVIKVMDV